QDEDLRSNPFQPGGDDEGIPSPSTSPQTSESREAEEVRVLHRVPTMLQDPSPYQRDPLVDIIGPMTRSRARRVHEDLNNLVQACRQDAQLIVEANTLENKAGKVQIATLLAILEEEAQSTIPQ
ncbi:hypothetical protein, partial [Salmonella enterica]|uniref:hypothetical protein n=1 Tax=Salmonella enterica TaxID=28901 RepID=UPI001F356AD7